jgi:vacuolar-type H+-ATPase subunit I/STV1
MLNHIKTINRNIASISKSHANIKELASKTALLTCDHARNHGDFSPMAQLINVIQSQTLKSSILAFYRDFTPVAFSYREGKLSASKNKEKEFSAIPADVNPSDYQHALSESEKEKKEKQKEKRESAKKEKEQSLIDLQLQANESSAYQAKAKELQGKLADSKETIKENKETIETLQARVVQLEKENKELRETISRLSSAVSLAA